MKKGKLLIFSAPSGSGKTTLVKHLMSTLKNIRFSISATSRPPRGEEKNGIDYYFLSADDFKRKIDSRDFVEWEEVYINRYYGTLKSEVEKLRNEGFNVVFDVDVVGGLNIKKYYGNEALSVFIMPPSVKVLRERLAGRGTDSAEEIKIRIDKAEYELSFADKFDVQIINDDLEIAKNETIEIVSKFLKQ